jgi:hypothetical protein
MMQLSARPMPVILVHAQNRAPTGQSTSLMGPGILEAAFFSAFSLRFSGFR